MGMKTFFAPLLILLALSLAACGNRGSLYLPEHPPVSEQRPGPEELTGEEREIVPPDPAAAPIKDDHEPVQEPLPPKPPGTL